MVVYIVDILIAKLLAIVVDFVFDIERMVYIDILFTTVDNHIHLRKAFVGKLEHLVYVFVLLFGKILFRVVLPADGACQIVTAVADTF